MASLCNCECGSYLEYFYQKLQDMWHEVDAIMTQNATTNNVEYSYVQTENNKEREMFAIAMHHLPLFEDDIEAKIPSTSSTTTHSKSTKKSEEYEQFNKSKTSSNQNTKDILKDSAVQDAEDMMWEFVDLEANTK